MISFPYVIVEYLGYLSFFFEIFILQMIFMRKFAKRSRFAIRVIISVALSSGFYFLPGISIGIFNISYIIVCAYSAAAAFFCFKVKIRSCIFYCLTAWAAQHIAWSFLLVLCYSVEMSTAVTVVAYLAIYLVTYSAIFFIYSYKRTDYEIVGDRISSIVIALIVMLLVVFVYDLVSYYDRQTVWYLVYAIISCILVLFVQYGQQSNMRNSLKFEQEKGELEEMIYRQSKQQQTADETMDIINRKCHDLKHQISALRTMNSEESGKYFDEIERAVMIYGEIVKTGNDALDIVLTEKNFLCEEKKIKFSYMADGGILNNLSAVDISALFGNILDNAIESSLSEEEARRIIRLNVSEVSGFVRIHCENYCSREVKFKGGLPVSARSYTGYHGFGSRSIKYIAEKYGGTLSMSLENDIFVVNIVIPVNKLSSLQAA